ncbi:MAG: hypothetical protein J6K32_09805 [Clostridia bacterium]|nr:hypothetical protein [Clostridia bacterium]
MTRSKRAMLAAGLIAGAAAMTGCAAKTTPAATAAPPAAQQETAGPQTTEQVTGATASPEANDADAPSAISLTVLGTAIEEGAVSEDGVLFLPLIRTGEALGWEAESEEQEEETQTRRTITLSREDSRITVGWVTSDNTTKQITWQKDGLLIPVDARIRTVGDTAYVPSAFFEEAMDAVVTRKPQSVSVERRAAKETPPTQEQEGLNAEESADENSAG